MSEWVLLLGGSTGHGAATAKKLAKAAPLQLFKGQRPDRNVHQLRIQFRPCVVVDKHVLRAFQRVKPLTRPPAIGVRVLGFSPERVPYRAVRRRDVHPEHVVRVQFQFSIRRRHRRGRRGSSTDASSARAVPHHIFSRVRSTAHEARRRRHTAAEESGAHNRGVCVGRCVGRFEWKEGAVFSKSPLFRSSSLPLLLDADDDL